MKRFRKVFAALTLVCMLMSVASTLSVSAAAVAWYHLGTKMTFEQNDAEVVTVSVDFEKKQDSCYMFTMSSPKEAADPYSTITWQNVLSVMLASDGTVHSLGDGNWIDKEEDGAIIGEDVKADGQVHNLKIKHYQRTKRIILYIDDIYAYTADYTNRITTDIVPCNMIVVSGDSNNQNDAGIVYNVASVIGTANNELGVELASRDEAKQTVTLNFSEVISDTIEGAQLRSANTAKGGKSYSLIQKEANSAKVTFEYTGELDSLEEYVIELPAGLTGKFGSVLSENRLYFCTAQKSKTLKNSDYTTYDTNADIKIMTGTTWRDRSLYKDLYPGAYEVFSWQGPYAGGQQYIWNTYNWATADNRAIPTGSGTSVISFDVIPKKANMQMGFDLRHDSIESNSASKGYEIVLDEAGNILAASGAMTYGWTNVNGGWDNEVIGHYEVDKPFNIKYEIDKPNKTLKVYIDNVLKRTVVETTGDQTTLLNTTTESYLNIYEMFGHNNTCIYGDRETLFLIDNVKLETDAAAVKEANFNNANGERVKAFATSDSVIGSVDLYFNRDMDKTALDGATKVYYGETEVTYTSAYNESEKRYTITPSSSMTANGDFRVDIAGVVSSGVMMPKEYSTYVKVNAFSTDCSVEIVDANGEKVNNITSGKTYYVEANLVNSGDDVMNVYFMVAAYDGNNVLKKVIPATFGVDVGGRLSINKDSENKIEITAGDDTAAIKVFAWKVGSLVPICANDTATK